MNKLLYGAFFGMLRPMLLCMLLCSSCHQDKNAGSAIFAKMLFPQQPAKHALHSYLANIPISRTYEPSSGAYTSSGIYSPSWRAYASSRLYAPSWRVYTSSRNYAPSSGGLGSGRTYAPSSGGLGASRTYAPSSGGLGSSRTYEPSSGVLGSSRTYEPSQEEYLQHLQHRDNLRQQWAFLQEVAASSHPQPIHVDPTEMTQKALAEGCVICCEEDAYKNGGAIQCAECKNYVCLQCHEKAKNADQIRAQCPFCRQ